MNFKTFIDRPILSSVISIVIVLLGIIALTSLPVEQYPDISTPTVMVEASYTGADAQTIQKSVIIPLEEKINGVENMIYMTSDADNNGNASIKVYFKQGTNADMATVNVQNRVSEASGQLPAEVTKSGVKVSKQQSSQVMIFNLDSSDDAFDDLFLSNYLKINIVPRILRIQGVGGVDVIGSDYAIRIWLNPEKMAQYELTPSDISAAVGAQNLEYPAGNFGESSDNTFQYALKYRGRYETPEEFGEIAIRALSDGEVLRLKDVADIKLGAQDYSMSGEADGHPGTTCMITQIAGSNASEIVSEVEALFEELEPSFPPGVKISITQNVKDFLDASIKNVLMTLLEAMLLVILVVYIFLQNGRLTLIPTISMLVSMIGTFFVLSLLGFTINLLTLFALVLSIGTVVDNAIIVVEAVQAKIDSGEQSAYKATVEGMSGVTTAILISTLVFMAVFIPVSFISGTSGKFFQQFGLTMAVAVGFSALNALTLSPALCALLLKPATGSKEKRSWQDRFRKSFNTSFEALKLHYGRGVKFLLKHKLIACFLLLLALVLLVVSMKNTKTGLVPNEDQGMFFVNVTTAPGSSLHQTKAVMDEVEAAIKDIPQIQTYAKNPGFGVISGKSSSSGLLIVRLKPWSERKGKGDSVDEVIAEVYRRTTDIKGAEIFAYSPPMVVGFGMTDGFEMYTQDKTGGDVADFYAVTQNFVEELNKRPEIGMAYTSFNINYPQYRVEVDAAKCLRSGISPEDVLSVLSGYYGGLYSSDINRFSKVYRVMLQASAEYRLEPESLDNVFVRTDSGMAPIAQFISLEKVYGPEVLNRFNMFGSIAVNGSPAEGYSSGDAIKAVRQTADNYLPTGYGYEFSGMTREESGSQNNTVLIMLLCIVLVYLILSALYESFIIPLAVILSVPVGLMGSFLFTWLLGLENNIYLQTGVIMLIGLLAKTAILITELAQHYRQQGMSINEAALRAAKERLRPILMTALTMIVGLLPLIFSTGAGKNGNISLGVGTAAGMTLGTFALLFITPVLFTIMQRLQEKIHRRPKLLSFAVLLFMLCSCGVYSDYQRPEQLPIDGLYRDSISTDSDSTFLASLSWKDLFTDPLLVEWIEVGLENNSDMGIARLKLEEAMAALNASKLAFLPSLELEMESGVSSTGGGGLTNKLALSSEWEIDLFGRLSNAKKQNAEELERSEAYVQAVQTQLIAHVAEMYYSLILLDKQLNVTKQTVANWEETVNILSALMVAGESDLVAVSMARASLLKAQQSMVSLEKEIFSLENFFSALLGIVPQRIKRGECFSLDMPSDYSLGLPLELLGRRPDVRMAERELAKAFYATNVARANFYPRITLGGSAGWTSSASETILDPASFLANALGSLLQPLFNRGENVKNLRIAQAQREEALLSYTQKILDAGCEVNEALCQWESAQKKLELSGRRVEELKKSVENTRLKMKYGSVNYLEVLEAQQSLLEAQLQSVSDMYEEVQGIICLYHSLGGGAQ